jgi:hypothetical protein
VPAALAAVVLVLCGCSTGGGEGPSTSSGGTTSSTSPTTTDDPPPTTTEDPDPTTPATTTRTNANPAIAVARLPVGGQSDDDPDDPSLQCAHVSWIVDQGGDGEIPKGTAVEITRALFTPDVFTAQRSRCGTDKPSCIGYIFRSTQQQCDLLVRVVGTVPQGVAPSVGFRGLVYCPRNTSESCRRFVAALANQKQISVDLNVPRAPEPEPTTQTTTDEPATQTTVE